MGCGGFPCVETHVGGVSVAPSVGGRPCVCVCVCLCRSLCVCVCACDLGDLN